MESIVDDCDVNKGEDVGCDIASMKPCQDFIKCELLTTLVFPKTMPSKQFQKYTGQGPYVSCIGRHVAWAE